MIRLSRIVSKHPSVNFMLSAIFFTERGKYVFRRKTLKNTGNVSKSETHTEDKMSEYLAVL